MLLDTSAIIAAIVNEPGAKRFQDAMLAAESLSISAITVLETRIVLHAKKGSDAVREFENMLLGAAISVVSFDAEMAVAAFDAFRRFGKRTRPPSSVKYC